MSALKVLIVGAGLGGLSLAQSLSRAGIPFEIFERDSQPFERLQGYRLHLDADAINAAREVLTPELREVFEHTSQWTEPYTTILKTDLSVVKPLMTNDDHGDAWGAHDGPPIHANVDRATFRQILISGLGKHIHYGKTLVRYESLPDKVIAHFADGSEVEGDVLVGADGIRSPVRHQRAPTVNTVDSGIVAIYGRIPMATAEKLVPPETLSHIFTVAPDERKVFLGMGSVRFPVRPDEAAAKYAPGAVVPPQDDYVVCITGGRREFFPEILKSSSSAALQAIAADMFATWPPLARDIVRSGDPNSFFLVEMYTSVPCTLDAPTNVTLVGDAIHAMTPTLGRGANVAMRDGALLGRALRKVADDGLSISEALTGYEAGMLDYGFAVVREAAETGHQRMAQNPLPV